MGRITDLLAQESGALPVNKGGTGAVTAEAARTSLQLANGATTPIVVSPTPPSNPAPGTIWLKPE